MYKNGVQLASHVITQADSWQQLVNQTLLVTYSPLSGHEKTRETRNDLKYLQFLKKEYQIGSKSEKVCKQVRDQIVWKQVEDTAQGLL